MSPGYNTCPKLHVDIICELMIAAHEPNRRGTLTVHLLLHKVNIYYIELPMMAHSYASEYPSSIAIDPQIVQFFEDFYRTTDINTQEAHEQYVNNFKKDAVFVMASKTVRGHEGSFSEFNKMSFHYAFRGICYMAVRKTRGHL
jgi:hypothetical protein